MMGVNIRSWNGISEFNYFGGGGGGAWYDSLPLCFIDSGIFQNATPRGALIGM
jgi:hypothetical protein